MFSINIMAYTNTIKDCDSHKGHLVHVRGGFMEKFINQSPFNVPSQCSHECLCFKHTSVTQEVRLFGINSPSSIHKHVVRYCWAYRGDTINGRGLLYPLPTDSSI